ncbi:hypothetical protein NSE01_05710 [Novosphingobium sediminis]|uniref:Baseplate protein J-like domain-containing protein n=1 Tax=Novosphingobium sediminis TaxID=707214 RepID=A0A512AGA0_9SPHN|nr:hypothetical protein [Novosphingobium sediminis]GEN98738.1 hypothetical protein NSE01_05710 [Novosphingobium sediminis]
MACTCDTHDCTALAIPAGLQTIPRAIGTFSEWRTALLGAIGREPLLDAWRARDRADFGVMLTEMFAYMGDVTSFYDMRTCNAAYLGTASDPAAVRALTGLLGYKPRPGLGASVWLSAQADGVRPVSIPQGTAFRSGAFPGSPPQVFEVQQAETADPRVNRLAIDRVPATSLPSPLTGLPVEASTLRAGSGTLVVIASPGGLVAARIAQAAPMALRIRRPVTMAAFAAAVTPPSGATYANTRLLRGGARCGVWKHSAVAGDPAVLSGATLALEARVPIHAGDVVAFEAGGVIAARCVISVGEAQFTVLAGQTSTLTDSANKVSTLVSPAVTVGTTTITLDSALPYAAADLPGLVVHYAMADAATLHAPLKDTLASGDPVHLPDFIDPPRVPVTHVALEDAHGEAVVTSGALDAASRSAALSAAPIWPQDLVQPVKLYGNTFLATRGESVHGEVIGTGNAALPLQTFRLKKKPLTYLAAANAAGRVSTLAIHVGGVQWREVDSFYGQPADAPVYVVRHDAQGETDIDFGGALRLPSGAQVTADYRFGAGSAVPPADSVKQIARPIAKLRSVRNVLPAFGGADAEAAEEIRYRGPASALLLGRAISLVDIEAAAAQTSGVRAVRAVWAWDRTGQRPAAMVRYIGDPQLAAPIRAALRALAEDDAPITVISAAAQSVRLDVAIDVSPDYVADAVAGAVGAVLFAPVGLPGTGGLLRPERLGPDSAVFASMVIKAIMDVPGVTALSALSLDGTPFTDVARAPAAGSYFDFADGGVRVNGRLAG